MLLVTTLTVLSLCQLYLPLTGSTDTNTKKNACTRFGDYPLKEHSPDCYENPNVLSSTVKMIRQSGYDVQEHDVVTGDGYKSRIFRIPVRDNDNRKNKQPVVLQHGVLVNSAVWTWAGNRSLANAGYDVWLANQRDSGYTTHKTYKTSDYNFWSNR
ncbi:lysosomal acid lipase/cholesteryl ester hydrolase-like [Zophobas morio]|uniref:lysosomal acid lipase/cholesteryl ester hydrolase-like n=1 Tax=Zophobas morio TaxID=2755281 RepID=UPI003082A23A